MMKTAAESRVPHVGAITSAFVRTSLNDAASLEACVDALSGLAATLDRFERHYRDGGYRSTDTGYRAVEHPAAGLIRDIVGQLRRAVVLIAADEPAVRPVGPTTETAGAPTAPTPRGVPAAMAMGGRGPSQAVMGRVARSAQTVSLGEPRRVVSLKTPSEASMRELVATIVGPMSAQLSDHAELRDAWQKLGKRGRAAARGAWSASLTRLIESEVSRASLVAPSERPFTQGDLRDAKFLGELSDKAAGLFGVWLALHPELGPLWTALAESRLRESIERIDGVVGDAVARHLWANGTPESA